MASSLLQDHTIRSSKPGLPAQTPGQDGEIDREADSENSPKLLACLVNPDKGKIHTLSNSEVVIGRASSCEILINTDATVSRRHATVTMSDGEYYLEDLDSRNGTVVNGEIVKNSRVKLKPDDKIQIGKTSYIFSPIGLSQALYGSQIKQISLESRVSLSSKAARKLVEDLVKSLKQRLHKLSRLAMVEGNAMQAEIVPLRK